MVKQTMYGIRLGLLLLALGFAVTAGAQTEIHKCTDADGGVVYSQLPCAPERPDDVESEQAEEPAENAPLAEPEEEFLILQAAESPPKSAEEIAACKKGYRDQIDAIDAEIQREYSQEKADDYKQRLLQLTRQLRQC